MRTAASCLVLLVLAHAASAQDRFVSIAAPKGDSLVGDWTSPELGREDIRVRSTGDSTLSASAPGVFVAQCFIEGTSLIGLARFQAPRTLGSGDWSRFLLLRATWASPTTLKVTWSSPANGKSVSEETWYFLPPPASASGNAATPAASGALPRFGDYVYVEVLAEAVTRVSPSYPDEAREKHVDGTVMVQALVGTDGFVKDVRVVKSIPLLDEAAKAAVRQWRFNPALAHGNPIAVWVGVPVKFSIH
jgi:TonB family protein